MDQTQNSDCEMAYMPVFIETSKEGKKIKFKPWFETLENSKKY